MLIYQRVANHMHNKMYASPVDPRRVEARSLQLLAYKADPLRPIGRRNHPAGTMEATSKTLWNCLWQNN